MQFTTNSEKFAVEFNQTVPGTYRKLTTEDVRLLTECGLIGRYRFYNENDIRTVINILLYEKLREKKIETQEKAVLKIRSCRSCSKPLPPDKANKKGRRKEYCEDCEPLRAKNRYNKWRKNVAAPQPPQNIFPNV